jgi:mannose-6-phosphate isomerase
MSDRQRDLGHHDIANTLLETIHHFGYTIAEQNHDKPWGFYIRLVDKNAEQFIDHYFFDIKHKFESFENISPKFLALAPAGHLSWQYHLRRDEIWKAVKGPLGIFSNEDDNLPSQMGYLGVGEIAHLGAGIRHKLVGLEDWGIVAEIWKHKDGDNPSDENDIIRVHDNYGRQSKTSLLGKQNQTE